MAYLGRRQPVKPLLPQLSLFFHVSVPVAPPVVPAVQPVEPMGTSDVYLPRPWKGLREPPKKSQVELTGTARVALPVPSISGRGRVQRRVTGTANVAIGGPEIFGAGKLLPPRTREELQAIRQDNEEISLLLFLMDDWN